MLEVRKILLDSTVIQVPGSIVTNMGEDKVMMNIDKGKYYNLGDTGGVIWEFIKKPITVQELVDEMVSEYKVSAIECEKQVLGFLESLRHEGLIQIVD